MTTVKRTWLALAAALALGGAPGCERRHGAGEPSAKPSSAGERIEQANREAEKAYDQAEKKEKEARKQQRQATEAERDLSEAQAKAAREKQEAAAAQEAAKQQAEQAHQTAVSSHQAVDQAKAEPAAPETAASGEQMVTGKVTNVSDTTITVEPAGKPAVTAQIDPATSIVLEGQTKSVTSITQGSEVRVSFKKDGDKTIATRIEDTGRQPVGGSAGQDHE